MNLNRNFISIASVLIIMFLLIKPLLSFFYASFYVYDLPASVNAEQYSIQGFFNQLKYANQYMANFYVSLKVSLLGTFFSCLFSCMVAYGLSIYKFRFIKLFYFILILMILIPEFVKVFPFFITLKKIGLLNNDLALWLPYVAPSLAIFIVKYYIDVVMNKEVIEAARIDGAGEWRIFYSIMLPILKPAIAIIVVIQFTHFWTAYDLSILIMAEEELKTFAHINLYVFPLSIIGSMIVVVPSLVLFFAVRSIVDFLNLYGK